MREPLSKLMPPKVSLVVAALRPLSWRVAPLRLSGTLSFQRSLEAMVRAAVAAAVVLLLSVMVFAVVSIPVIVVLAGMPVPVMDWPTARLDGTGWVPKLMTGLPLALAP